MTDIYMTVEDHFKLILMFSTSYYVILYYINNISKF